MFDKITNAAERLATNVSESRRGFLGRVGQAALGATGAVVGWLALPTQAQAASHFGYCGYLGTPHGPVARLSGICVASDCTTRFLPAQCRGFGDSPGTICGNKSVTFGRSCSW